MSSMASVNNASARGTVKAPAGKGHENCNSTRENRGLAARAHAFIGPSLPLLPARQHFCTGLCRVETQRLPLDGLVSSMKARHRVATSDE